MYFKAVKINKVTATAVNEVKYSSDMFNFGTVNHEHVGHKSLLRYRKWQVYGPSAHGLATDTLYWRPGRVSTLS
ncbi:MAG: Glucans biosynthesis protein G [Sodalis sp.]|nr:MAG: Glucans biosynthesis protein G [Sodalis sp.]